MATRLRRGHGWFGTAALILTTALAAVAVSGGLALANDTPRTAPLSSITDGQTCAWQETLSGAPDHSLLSILGVLRKRAAPLSAKVLAQIELPTDRQLGIEYYVDYIRRARFYQGIPYYIAAIHFDSCSKIRRSGDAIAVIGAGGGGPGGTAKSIVSGSFVVTGGPGIAGNPDSGTVTLVVPDGVASATIHYPAGPANTLKPKAVSPPITITASAVGNLLLFNVPRDSGGAQIFKPTSMIWRDAKGKIVKRFSHRL